MASEVERHMMRIRSITRAAPTYGCVIHCRCSNEHWCGCLSICHVVTSDKYCGLGCGTSPMGSDDKFPEHVRVSE